MKLIIYILISLLATSSFVCQGQEFNFELKWATYFGDENIRLGDNAVDKEGNIYFVGAIKNGSYFNATSGSHQSVYGGGNSDGFLVRMDALGQIVWATYFGGEHSDFISGL